MSGESRRLVIDLFSMKILCVFNYIWLSDLGNYFLLLPQDGSRASDVSVTSLHSACHSS
jgi:hypothetical protein